MPQMGNMDEGAGDAPRYADENEQLLFGPTTRPNETLQAAARRPAIRRPQNMERYMADLAAAAEAPDAPQELQDLLRVLQYHAGGR